MRRLRQLTEAECYARCYGASDDTVRIVHLPPRPKRFRLRVTGEDLRRGFEERLDRREPSQKIAGEERALEGALLERAADAAPERDVAL